MHKQIAADLREKMVFVGGPRQVGKTTMAKAIGQVGFKKPMYLNWDFRDDRKAVVNRIFSAEADLLIFDEIHKYRHWRNYLKGEYDKNSERYAILVTGSARLDLYRRGGDSLLGRYHYFRLHPFSLAEAAGLENKIKIFSRLDFKKDFEADKLFKRLFKFGGFPEPFLGQNETNARRFYNARVDRLIKDDIREIENVRDLSALQILTELIPEKVGSLFSLNSLVEDLGATHKTISLWVDVLERFYFHYRLYLFASTKIKSLRKEPKIYLWDWSGIENEAFRLENMVASHLLKLVHYFYDAAGYKAELNFLRDRDGHEVDFIVSINKKPWLAVEVKLNDEKISKNLYYFAERLKIPFLYQVVASDNKGLDYLKDNIRVINAAKFLSGLI